jgi:hypothetical protein
MSLHVTQQNYIKVQLFGYINSESAGHISNEEYSCTVKGLGQG